MLNVSGVRGSEVLKNPLRRIVWNPFAPPLLAPVPCGVNTESSANGRARTTEPSLVMCDPSGVHHWISLSALSSLTGSPDTHTGRPPGPSVGATSMDVLQQRFSK